MLGTSLQMGRGHGEDRFYNPVKARRTHHQHRHGQKNPRSSSASAGVSPSQMPMPSKDKPVVVELENRVEEPSAKTVAAASVSVSSSSATATHSSNLDRFLESTTPSVPAQYLSKTRIRGWRTCDVKFQPYFTLADLWESFKEWSAYGAGVPLLLNGNDSVVQYYVPYLSGIQLYGESIRPSTSSRRPGEESDGEYYRESSSDGSSDYENDNGLKYSMAWNSNHTTGSSSLRMDRLSLREKHVLQQDGSSSDDGDSGYPPAHLLFEFLEKNPPFIREPLADKISNLAQCFPALKTLRSCDLLPSSWMSVAWYPIYRIPTGPTLKDLDACFLTFHSLSTMVKGAGNASGPTIIYSKGADGVPKVCLPSFGLASYKFKGSIWIPNGGTELQLVNSLQQTADNWLRLLSVHHPDYRFFVSHGAFRR